MGRKKDGHGPESVRLGEDVYSPCPKGYRLGEQWENPGVVVMDPATCFVSTEAMSTQTTRSTLFVDIAQTVFLPEKYAEFLLSNPKMIRL